MADSWAKSPAVRASMRANKWKDTQPELRVRRIVHAAGMRYRVNARPLPGRNFTADLVFSRAKIAVFIDGCFWHGCPAHLRPAKINAEFWAAKIEGNRARDAQVDAWLHEAGWLSLRAWEHEDPVIVAARIHREWLSAVRPETGQTLSGRAYVGD